MKLNDFSLKVLDKRFNQEKDKKVRERLRVLILLREGRKQRDIASALRISNGLVPFWKKRFEEEGFDGLKDKEGRGKKHFLGEEKLSMIHSAIAEGLQMENGYQRGFKTKDIVELIANNFEKIYTTGHCRRILNNSICSLQVPRPKNKRRNEKEVKKFLKEFKKKERVWVIR